MCRTNWLRSCQGTEWRNITRAVGVLVRDTHHRTFLINNYYFHSRSFLLDSNRLKNTWRTLRPKFLGSTTSPDKLKVIGKRQEITTVSCYLYSDLLITMTSFQSSKVKIILSKKGLTVDKKKTRTGLRTSTYLVTIKCTDQVDWSRGYGGVKVMWGVVPKMVL